MILSEYLDEDEQQILKIELDMLMRQVKIFLESFERELNA